VQLQFNACDQPTQCLCRHNKCYLLSLQLVFYIHGSVHRNSGLKKSNKMQHYADIYLPLNYSTCFGRPSRPSSGIHITLIATSGTDHTIWEACFADSMIRMIRNKTTKQQREVRVLLWVLFSPHKYYITSIFVLFFPEYNAYTLRSASRSVACR